MWIVRLAAVATISLGGLLLVPSEASNASGDLTSQSTIEAYGSEGYLTKTDYSNGDSESVFAQSQMISQSAETTETVGGSERKSVTTSLSPPLFDYDRYTPQKPTKEPSSQVDAYEAGLAIGLSDSEAMSLESVSWAGSTPATAAKGSQPTAGGGGSASATATSGAVRWGNPVCFSRYSDGKRIHAYGCDQQFRVYANGGDWYMTDKFQATIVAHDTGYFPDAATGLRFGDYYSRNNTLYKWSPSSTSELGSCKEQSVSVTVKTVTVSESSTVCPETFGPYDIDTRIFTSRWDGQGSGPSNGAREVHGVSGWHSPSNANPTRSIRYTYWWA